MYWNEYTTKRENKDTTNKHVYFFESYFVDVKRFFKLIFSNEDDNAKSYKDRRYYLAKGNTKNYNVTVNGKTSVSNQLVLI